MDDWRLLFGGAWAKLRAALRLSRADGRPIVPVSIAFGVVPWLVTLAIAWLAPGGGPDAVRKVLSDCGFTTRLLLAVPILLLDEFRVDRRISLILPGVVASNLFSSKDIPAWEDEIQKTRRRITERAPLFVLAALVAISVVSNVLHPSNGSSGDWMSGPGPAGLSWAGLWYALVGRPIFLFLVLLWLWRWLSISLFIWRTSRSPLLLQPSHPDGMGGLAIFMELTTASMSLIFATSAVVSAEVYYEMANGAATLRSYGPLLIALLVLALLFALGPFFFFSPLLARLKRRALYLYGVLASKHSTLFESRWFVRDPPTSELLGASEISSLTDLASAYFVARSIQTVPFGRGTIIATALAAALPMIPVVLLEVPLREILSRIAKFVM